MRLFGGASHYRERGDRLKERKAAFDGVLKEVGGREGRRDWKGGLSEMTRERLWMDLFGVASLLSPVYFLILTLHLSIQTHIWPKLFFPYLISFHFP